MEKHGSVHMAIGTRKHAERLDPTLRKTFGRVKNPIKYALVTCSSSAFASMIAMDDKEHMVGCGWVLNPRKGATTGPIPFWFTFGSINAD